MLASRYRLCLFDAYGTLFDLSSVAQRMPHGWASGAGTACSGGKSNWSTPGCEP